MLHDHGHQVPQLVLPAVRHEVRHRAVDLPYGTSHTGYTGGQFVAQKAVVEDKILQSWESMPYLTCSLGSAD